MPDTDVLTKKPFTCKRCRQPVAETDGISIFFGVKPVPMNPRRILFTCPHCKAEVHWETARNGNALPNTRKV
jgi:hypothetical protein